MKVANSSKLCILASRAEPILSVLKKILLVLKEFSFSF